MMVNTELKAWFEHRIGLTRLSDDAPTYVFKFLQSTDIGRNIIDTYGRSEIQGFIGFVDLVGFSDIVKGYEPKRVAEYLNPFLKGMIRVLYQKCAIDKTIGDEIMFLLPNKENEVGGPRMYQVILEMGQVLGGICSLKRDLEETYHYRLGLSYGVLYLDMIQSNGYREWTVFGEVVNLAKRLHDLPGIEIKSGFGGAFGVLMHDNQANMSFESILKTIAGSASRVTHKVVNDKVELKGVSPARCAILQLKGRSDR